MGQEKEKFWIEQLIVNSSCELGFSGTWFHSQIEEMHKASKRGRDIKFPCHLWVQYCPNVWMCSPTW